jgi:UDP-N-acetylmuramoyl-L-alanyl-D-glutamate--2,6-diaminopimelate ligase
LFRKIRKLIPNSLVNTVYHLPKAALANIFYGFPSKRLKIIGVTGTDGKTTTSTLIYEILKKAGQKAALITTVKARIGNFDISTGLHVTSPNPWKLQQLLKLAKTKGIEYLVLEVTSHGLDQYRLFGINFYISVITNITDEHLDYHKTYSRYFQAKAKMFSKPQYAVLNKEDENSFNKLKLQTSGKVVSYGLADADYTPKNFEFKTKLLGNFNKLNCLAAISTAKTVGIKDSNIKKALAEFTGVKGRMEKINLGQDFKVFIDFAHTPNALKNALQTLNSLPHNKITAVFGCAGLRDFKKRPKMGKISCRLADKVILTAEDPRTEDLQKIMAEIKKGCQHKEKISRVADRAEAINKAVMEARNNDIIGVFGKGHEQSMCFGKKEQKWSDHEVVIQALKQRLKKD